MKIFSVRSSPDPPIFKKIAFQSSPDLAKNGFSPDLCSTLLCIWGMTLVAEISHNQYGNKMQHPRGCWTYVVQGLSKDSRTLQ